MTISEQIKEYKSLLKEISLKKKKIKMQEIELLKNSKGYFKLSQQEEKALYDFSENVKKPVLKEIEALEKKKKLIEMDFNVSVPFGDLMANLVKLKKKRGKLRIDVSQIRYPWGNPTKDKVEDAVNSGKFKPFFDICVYTNATEKNADYFYFRKTIELNHKVKFKTGTLKDNIKLTGDSGDCVEFINIDDMFVNFNIKDLAIGNVTWYPFNGIVKSVLAIVDEKEKKKEKEQGK